MLIPETDELEIRIDFTDAEEILSFLEKIQRSDCEHDGIYDALIKLKNQLEQEIENA